MHHRRYCTIQRLHRSISKSTVTAICSSYDDGVTPDTGAYDANCYSLEEKAQRSSHGSYDSR